MPLAAAGPPISAITQSQQTEEGKAAGRPAGRRIYTTDRLHYGRTDRQGGKLLFLQRLRPAGRPRALHSVENISSAQLDCSPTRARARSCSSFPQLGFLPEGALKKTDCLASWPCMLLWFVGSQSVSQLRISVRAGRSVGRSDGRAKTVMAAFDTANFWPGL